MSIIYSGPDIEGVLIEDQGVSQGPAIILDFVGAGVTAAVLNGIATITIPGGLAGIDVQDEGVPVGTFQTFNFTGAGVTATDQGGGVAKIDIPGGSVLLGAENIFVSKAGNNATGTNSDEAKPFLTITAAIAKAVTLIPSNVNIINIIVYPGSYTESFTVPDFVNLISAVDSPFIYSGVVYSLGAVNLGTTKRPVNINGTVTINGNNIICQGFNCNTLALTFAGGSPNARFTHIIASTAITSTVTNNSTWWDVHSPVFLRLVSINGFMSYCSGDVACFSSSVTAATAGTMGGIFNYIIADTDSFASNQAGTGAAGDITGNMTFCEGGQGSYSSVQSVSANGANAGNISASMFKCKGGNISFSSVSGDNVSNAHAGNMTGIFDFLTAGNVSFSSQSQVVTAAAGIISGAMTNAIAGNQSYCFNSSGGGGVALISSIKFINNSGGTDCFCSASVAGTPGIVSGVLDNITAGINFMRRSTLSGTLINTTHSTTLGLSSVILSGRLSKCRIQATTLNTSAIKSAANGLIEYCDLKCTGGAAFAVASSGGAISMDLRHSNTYGQGIDPNITLLTTTPYNTNDVNSRF